MGNFRPPPKENPAFLTTSTNTTIITYSMQTPADQVTQNMMLEISNIQETLLLMNEGLHAMNEGLRDVKERIRELSEEKVKEQARPTVFPAPSAHRAGPARHPVIVTPN